MNSDPASSFPDNLRSARDRTPHRGASQVATSIELQSLTPPSQKLKNGTFILPSTGERVRRQITLRRPLVDGSLGSEEDLSLDENRPGRLQCLYDDAVKATKDLQSWLQSRTAKNIAKCSLAYMLGSMGTFFPPFASFLGRQDGKHIVATITVYFHPARSAGSMVEAALCGLAAFIYAVIISVSSMGVAVFCETQLGLIELGYALILIVFCGGGLGFVGWIKQVYNAPLVNVACSLTSLAIITVLTKEESVQTGVFSDDKIVQVMKMVMMGIASTSLVNLCLWPVSARAELRESMIQMSESLGDMLTLITAGFLSGSEKDLQSASYETTAAKHKAAFSQLPKNLKEAKLEHYLRGTEVQYEIEAKLVNCLQRLAHSIGGLRSAAATQFDLMREPVGSGLATPVKGHRLLTLQSPSGTSRLDRQTALSAIEEASEENSIYEDLYSPSNDLDTILNRSGTDLSLSSMRQAKTPAEIFARFITHLGPSMKSLVYTLSETLNELPFGRGPKYEILINEHFMSSLQQAL